MSESSKNSAVVLGGKRETFSSSSLAALPFQLLPRVVHPAPTQEAALLWQQQFSEALAEKPMFSVVVQADSSTSNSRLQFAESLRVQSYQSFELLEMDQRSSLQELLGKSKGDYLLFAPRESLLHPQALYLLIKTVLKKKPDLLYSNAVFTENGFTKPLVFLRRAPVDKYSLLSSNTLGEGLLIKRAFAEELFSGLNLNTSFQAAAWHIAAEAALREKNVFFLPLALFLIEQEAADTSHSLDDLAIAASSYAEARDIPVSSFKAVADEPYALHPVLLDAKGEIQVIIPFKDNSELTIKCLRSLETQDIKHELVVTLVDNNSTAEERAKIDSALGSLSLRVGVIEDGGYFNFARLNNIAAAETTTPYILFLNNDVEITAAESLRELRSWCALEDVGAVGGSLLYEDGSLQSAGINFAGVRPCNVASRDQFSHVFRETNAVAFAMALVSREAYRRLGGLDEVACPNGFGDALFCQNLRNQGFRIIHTPQARAIHRESVSRGYMSEEMELFEMTQAGIPISDLYGDFAAELQPTRLNLVDLQKHERPLLQKGSPRERLVRGLKKISKGVKSGY